MPTNRRSVLLGALAVLAVRPSAKPPEPPRWSPNPGAGLSPDMRGEVLYGGAAGGRMRAYPPIAGVRVVSYSEMGDPRTWISGTSGRWIDEA